MKNMYEGYNFFLKEKSYNIDKKEYKMYYNYFKKNYLKHIGDNKSIKILDIGCGLGHFLYFLEKEGFKNIYGIDFDKDNIDHCKKINLNVTKADMYKFVEESKENFDLIVMNDVIEHIPREKTIHFLNKCRLMLNKNGRLFFKTVNCNNIYGLSSYFADFTHEVGYTLEKANQVSILSKYKSCKVHNLYVYPNIFVLDEVLYLLFSSYYKLKYWLFYIQGRKNNLVHSKNLLAIFYS